MEAFFMDDLFDEPDYIEKIMDIIQEAQLKRYRKMMEEQKPIAVWIGGWRSTPEMVSPAIFDRFVWPYLKDFANLCLEMSVVPMFLFFIISPVLLTTEVEILFIERIYICDLNRKIHRPGQKMKVEI